MGTPGPSSSGTENDILGFFRKLQPPSTPVFTEEIAESLECPQQTVRRSLADLADRGEIRTRQVDGKGSICWKPEGSASDGQRITSEQLYAFVSAVEDYAIFMLNPEGKIVSWNDGAERIKGYTKEEIVGEHFSTLYTDDDIDEGVPERNLETVTAEGRVEDEGWRVRKDGSRFWANVIITAIADEHGELRGYAKVTRDMTDRRERERAMRRERELIDRVFEASPVGLGVLSRESLERVNARAAEIYGSPTDEIDDYTVGEPAVYYPDGEPVPPDERPNSLVFETGEPVIGWECQLQGIDSRRRWCSVSAVPLTDDAGDVERVVVATEDITHFKEQARHLERQRDELEAELDDVFERVDDAFCALDEEFRFTHVNERAADLLQVRSGELLGESFWELYPGAKETPVWDGLHEAMETQEATEFEVYGEEIDRWLAASVYPSETGLSVYFRDVTERKRNEIALRKSEERFRTLMEHSPFSMQIFDVEGRPIETNPAWEQLWGASREELADYNIFQDEQLEAAGLLSHIRDAFDGEVVRLPIIHYDPAEIEKPGRARWIEGYVYPLWTKDEETVEVALVHHDITERKERERELEEYEQIIETVDDGIYVNDEEFRFKFVNEAYASLVGRSREELIGSNVTAAVDEETLESATSLLSDISPGEGGTHEFEIDTADGPRTLETKFIVLGDDDGEYAGSIGILRDITEHIELDRELERAYDLLKQTERIASVGGWEAAPDTGDVFWSDFLFDLLEWEEDDEPPLDEALNLYLEEDRPIIASAIEESVESGEPFDVEARLRTSGGAVRWLQIQGVPVMSNGEVEVIRGAAQDITERKERERQIKESNEHLEQFAYAASHDLQEPLRMVSSYLQLLDDRYADELDADAEEFIDYAVDGAQRMREMIDDLLTYSRIDTVAEPFEPTDTEAVVETVLRDIEVQIRETNAEIDVGSLPTVQADRRQLEQVFQNLVSNAIKYRGDDPPKIEISAERDGGKWVFQVADNGIGIDPDQTDRIFDVFERLHTPEEFSGTGVGLALCQKIIDRHGGDIWVESELGEESTFHFTIPIAEKL